MMFLRARSMSITATRSPIQVLFIISGGCGPDLEVVWPHEVFGDSLAEDGVNKLAEVPRRGGRGDRPLAALRPDQPSHALVRRVFGEITDVVLKRIRHPCLVHAHPRLAIVERELVAHELQHWS